LPGDPNQGAFIIDELTDLVEEAVLKELEAIAERGGVLGAMETGQGVRISPGAPVIHPAREAY
jgi:methylmalonyl-CoA mutase N-terminal domain/subunit